MGFQIPSRETARNRLLDAPFPTNSVWSHMFIHQDRWSWGWMLPNKIRGFWKRNKILQFVYSNIKTSNFHGNLCQVSCHPLWFWGKTGSVHSMITTTCKQFWPTTIGTNQHCPPGSASSGLIIRIIPEAEYTGRMVSIIGKAMAWQTSLKLKGVYPWKIGRAPFKGKFNLNYRILGWSYDLMISDCLFLRWTGDAG